MLHSIELGINAQQTMSLSLRMTSLVCGKILFAQIYAAVFSWTEENESFYGRFLQW